MELRQYNLMRQTKYGYEVIPSELIALAARRDKDRREKLSRLSRGWDRIILIGCLIGGAYLTGHVLWLVLR